VSPHTLADRLQLRLAPVFQLVAGAAVRAKHVHPGNDAKALVRQHTAARLLRAADLHAAVGKAHEIDAELVIADHGVDQPAFLVRAHCDQFAASGAA
jgi:hypothetical protein